MQTETPYNSLLVRKIVVSLSVSLLLAPWTPVLAQSDDDISIRTIAPLPEPASAPSARIPTKPRAAAVVPAAPFPSRPSQIVVQPESAPAAPSSPSSFSIDGEPQASHTVTANSASGGYSKLSFQNSDSAPASAAPPNAEPAGAAPADNALSDSTNSGTIPRRQIADKPADESIAQAPGSPNRRISPTGVVGTVKIRKPFRLFATEQLIHNLSFRDTPVREVIAEIARRGSLNILIDKSVTGKITGDLRDVTLNEAMDSVIAAAGLQHRTLDNNTVIVGTLQAIVQLGLNRPMARVFKLSYAHPYDVAGILNASVFNRGMVPDYTHTRENDSSSETHEDTRTTRNTEGGGTEPGGVTSTRVQAVTEEGPQTQIGQERDTQVNRPDVNRYVRGSSRAQTQEGVGYNNAATDPGSQQIRSFQEVNTDFIVDQNGGNAIVIPDSKNRQVIVVGTAEDLAVAEEAIHCIDRRPRQVHIQASLIEITNQGIRELGATLNVQGQGASASVMGNSAAPLVTYLPGLGSSGSNLTPVVPFTNPVTSNSPASAFTGLVGALLPTAPQIAGINAVNVAQSGFNFLTLGNSAGGRANIATVPTGLNLNVNLLLQTNKAKIVANPSVVVVDNTETLITIASEVVHKVTSTVSLGVVTTNVELTKAGIFLNVLPKITEDGFITMRLRPQVSTPLGAPQQFGSTTSPTVVTLLNVREIMSQEVRVKDGQTLVLGGLFTEQEAAQLAKVPYLAETPVLGALFRNSLKGRNRTETMLLLTPKVVEEDPTSLSETSPQPLM